MNNKFKYLVIIFCIAPIVFFFIRSFFTSSHLCELSSKFKKSEYNGVVIDKYLDQKNHRTKTITIKVNESNIDLILPRDTSSFFDFIVLGDSLFKEEQQNFIGVYRKDSLKTFKIYFGCDE